MKNAIFIYNPLSGDRSIVGKLDYIIERFQKQNILIRPYRIHSQSEKVIPDLLLQNEFDFAVVAGGDGTLNSIIDIILKNKPGLPVGIIPSGTCNDLARCLDLKPTVEHCIDVILGGKTKAIDVALIDESKYFLSSCAGGLFADASFSTDNELKKAFGPLAYYLKALTDVANVKPFRLKIISDNAIFDEDVLLFMVLNGKNAAGFSNIIEEADITDGIMDIILIKNCTHIDLASLFFKISSDDTLNDSNVIKIRTQECLIECSSKIKFSIDGEDGGGVPQKIRFVKQALTVFLP